MDRSGWGCCMTSETLLLEEDPETINMLSHAEFYSMNSSLHQTPVSLEKHFEAAVLEKTAPGSNSRVVWEFCTEHFYQLTLSQLCSSSQEKLTFVGIGSLLYRVSSCGGTGGPVLTDTH